jgi:hypothetical protein
MSGFLIVQELTRSFTFALIIAPIIIAVVFYGFYKNIKEQERKLFFLSLVIFLICTSGFFGIFRVYNDAWFGDKNTQMTYKDKFGTEWFLDHLSPDVPVITNRWNLFGWINYHFAKQDLPNIIYAKKLPQAHFGYNNFISLSDYYNHQEYYMLTHEAMLYQDVGVSKERMWRVADRLYNKEDFFRLNHETGIDKIFATNGFDIWYLQKN